MKVRWNACFFYNSRFWCRRTIIAGFFGMRQERRLTYFYFTSPNRSLQYDWEWEKQVLTSSSGLFGSEHTVVCFVTIRYLSVWCALYLELFGYKVRQILFFCNLAGNGMEQKNEPPIIKTLRGRKDTLIAENKYPLRKVTVCDRKRNAHSISGWEAPWSIDNEIPLMRMNIFVKS